MDIYNLEVDSIHGIIPINICRKSIKKIHLKVSSDLQVRLSAPYSVDNALLFSILQSKKNWIAKQLAKYKLSQGYNTLVDIKSGTSTLFLGKDIRILKKVIHDNENKEHVEVDEKSMLVYVKEDNEEKLTKLIHTFWREKAKEIFQQEIDRLYTKIFKKYDIAKPSLHIRKMKTRWGTCTQSKNKITLNEYLLKADLLCIQYVVLHELTHLLYPNHSKAFYTFLTIHMPDWKTRKERLDKDVVQGL